MSQSLANIFLHVVFSTKNREPFLPEAPLRRELYTCLVTVLKAYDSPALLIGGTADHVHVLCSLSRTQTLAKVIGETKRNSSKWLKAKGGSCGLFQWQNGYGAFSISSSNVQRVRTYIARQEEHHRRMTFQDELRALFRKHGMEFDERYVWD